MWILLLLCRSKGKLCKGFLTPKLPALAIYNALKELKLF